MVFATATGVVLDVAAVFVVAHLNFGASILIYDCVGKKIHFRFLYFFKYVFLKVKVKTVWRTTVSIRNKHLLLQTSAPILLSAA